MNFEIMGKLLARTVSLANKLQCDAKNILDEIYRKGLEAMEGIQPAQAERLSSEYITSFIEKNLPSMSNEQMAKELGLSLFTLRQYRRKMGLERIKGMSNSSSRLEVIKELMEEEKTEILSNPEYSHETLSQKLRKPILMIKRYRLDLAEQNILEYPGKETDVIAARKFGLKTSDYQRLRIKLRVLHPRGGGGPKKKIEPSELGTIDEVRYALTEGGQNIADIVRAKGLSITRSRAQQIIKEWGLNGEACQRKPLWYAHRLVGLEKTELARNLTTKEWVIQQLAESGGLHSLAAKLAITHARLGGYLRKNLGLKTRLERSHCKLVELKCINCQSSIWRAAALVDREKKNLPNKTTYFCSKICQGKWLGKHRKKRAKRTDSQTT
ncbi:MAG: hypothetical protein WCP15_02435 [bacterium]